MMGSLVSPSAVQWRVVAVLRLVYRGVFQLLYGLFFLFFPVSLILSGLRFQALVAGVQVTGSS